MPPEVVTSSRAPPAATEMLGQIRCATATAEGRASKARLAKCEKSDLQGVCDAAGGDRTHDLRIKSPLLCQLSYGGQVRMIAHGR